MISKTKKQLKNKATSSNFKQKTLQVLELDKNFGNKIVYKTSFKKDRTIECPAKHDHLIVLNPLVQEANKEWSKLTVEELLSFLDIIKQQDKWFDFGRGKLNINSLFAVEWWNNFSECSHFENYCNVFIHQLREDYKNKKSERFIDFPNTRKLFGIYFNKNHKFSFEASEYINQYLSTTVANLCNQYKHQVMEHFLKCVIEFDEL